MRNLQRLILFSLLALCSTLPACAHVNSKDIFQQLDAGSCKLFVTVRPPTVIPGVATVEIRVISGHAGAISLAALPLTGEASRFTPALTAMQPHPDDPTFFTGAVWLMSSGSWQVRLQVATPEGPATASLPIPATPLALLPMGRALTTLLVALALLLGFGLAAILAAAVREATLTPGTPASPAQTRHSRVAFALGLAFAALLFAAGKLWSHADATRYAAGLYVPDRLLATLSGNQLTLRLAAAREVDPVHAAMAQNDLLLDHGKPIHLYAIRIPQMDAAFHLHPTLVSGWTFQQTLPAMPPGTYRLFADIVHRNGFPETPTATLTIPPGIPPAPLAPDDASALPPPLSAGELGTAFHLPDGYTMTWDRPTSLTADTAYLFRFHLLDPRGHPAQLMQPYLGMGGHAAFVKADGSTFAHTHPEGSVAMPALALANPTAMPMASALSATVDFPYGFPSAGRYRIFIQMKHANTVETGVFDANVAP